MDAVNNEPNVGHDLSSRVVRLDRVNDPEKAVTHKQNIAMHIRINYINVRSTSYALIFKTLFFFTKTTNNHQIKLIMKNIK